MRSRREETARTDSSGYSTFLPTIINGLGKWTTAQVQLLTIPVYFLGAATYMSMAVLSDRIQRRAVFCIIFSIISVIGYAVLISDSSAGVHYFGYVQTQPALSPWLMLTIVPGAFLLPWDYMFSSAFLSHGYVLVPSSCLSFTLYLLSDSFLFSCPSIAPVMANGQRRAACS